MIPLGLVAHRIIPYYLVYVWLSYRTDRKLDESKVTIRMEVILNCDPWRMVLTANASMYTKYLLPHRSFYVNEHSRPQTSARSSNNEKGAYLPISLHNIRFWPLALK